MLRFIWDGAKYQRFCWLGHWLHVVNGGVGHRRVRLWGRIVNGSLGMFGQVVRTVGDEGNGLGQRLAGLPQVLGE